MNEMIFIAQLFLPLKKIYYHIFLSSSNNAWLRAFKNGVFPNKSDLLSLSRSRVYLLLDFAEILDERNTTTIS